MGSTPATANQPLYEQLRQTGLSKGEAARLANEKPLKPKSSKSKRVVTQKATKK